MQANLFVVLVDAVEGREQEFNDWYTNVHIRDVMRLQGSRAVQRFVRSTAERSEASAQKYLVIYEVADFEMCTREHHSAMFSPRMPISPHAALNTLEVMYFELLCSVNSNAYGEGIDGPVMAVRFDAKPGEDAPLAAEWSQRMDGIGALPGVIGAQLFRLARQQMYDMPTAHHYIALLRLDATDAGGPAWRRYHSTQDGLVGATDWTTVAAEIYTPLFSRLSAEEVRNPPPESVAAEAAARVAVGDGIPGPPGLLQN